MRPGHSTSSLTDSDYITLRLSIATFERQIPRIFLRLSIRHPYHIPPPVPITRAVNDGHFPEVMGIPGPPTESGSGRREKPHVAIPCRFTDGSPYWLPAEGEACPTVLTGNGAYQQALFQFSAAHSPSVDRGFYGPYTLADISSESIYPEADQSAGHLVLSEAQNPDAPTTSDSGRNTTSHPSGDLISAPASLTSTSLVMPGLVDDKDWLLYPPSQVIQEISQPGTPIMGRMYRELTGGDICGQLANISAHRHHGHNPDVKIRPAIGVPHLVASTHGRRQFVSKVGPLCQLPAFEYPDQISEMLAARRKPPNPVPHADQGRLESASSVDEILYNRPEDSGEHLAPAAIERSDSGRYISNFRKIGNSIASYESGISPGSSPWRAHSRNMLDSEECVPEPEKLVPFQMLSGAVHQGHGHVSKVRPSLPPDPYDVASEGNSTPVESFHHTLYPNPHAHSRGYLPAQHLGHNTISKVQPYGGDAISPDPVAFQEPSSANPGDEGINKPRRRLGSLKSASDLVAY